MYPIHVEQKYGDQKIDRAGSTTAALCYEKPKVRSGLSTYTQMTATTLQAVCRLNVGNQRETGRSTEPAPPAALAELLPVAVRMRPLIGQPVLDLAGLREAAANYTARAAEKLRAQGSVAGVLQIFVQTNPFKPNEPQYNQSISMPFPAPTADTRIMTSAALDGLERIYRPGYRYKKVGVMLLDLCTAEKVTPSLFDMAPKHSKALMAAVDAINRINGRGTIHLASEGIVQPWKMRRERMSRRYTTRWDELLQIG